MWMNNAMNTKNLTIYFILVELISFYQFLFEHTTDITFYLILTIYHINMCQIFFFFVFLYFPYLNLAFWLFSNTRTSSYGTSKFYCHVKCFCKRVFFVYLEFTNFFFLHLYVITNWYPICMGYSQGSASNPLTR